MLTKTIELELKTIGEAGDGRFTAYASVFDVVDSYGDMVVKGAFTDSLARFGSKGAGIPLYWRHRMDDPFMLIGQTLEAKEDGHGLWVDCELLDTNNAKQVHALLKARLVRQMSFSYGIVEAAWVDRKPEDGGSYYELRKLDLHEVSVAPVGANQETEILAVKSAHDAARAAFEDARRKADDQQPAPDGPAAAEDQGTADEPTEAKAEEPSGAKTEEPTPEQSKHHLGLITVTDAQ
ncbi:HK97 family phage prohead protease [Agromyces larvae]|uniref:HK97 family phage prohead protease n=1 Tax=Agromyces larvae TaxID=2929802 RepID=A0ABY4C240_9MICO|nr:HK97 family phage prohead protease [Agromyces larvae]UOE45480.1 HK97 family phage prohead protease [Agromyces larvae]